MNVKVSVRAKKTFQSIKESIRLRWGDRVALVFQQRVIDFLDLIEIFPEIGTLEIPEKRIYGFQLTKQTRVFYRIKEQTVIIIIFFDVRQNPKKKPA